MSGRTIFFLALVVFAIFAIVKVFDIDTSDPNDVVDMYLRSWRGENAAGMYPLLSSRAKAELSRQQVTNIADYFVRFAEFNKDLLDFQIIERRLGEQKAYFSVKMRFRDMLGRNLHEEVQFFLVLEKDGWRVDGYRGDGNSYFAIP